MTRKFSLDPTEYSSPTINTLRDEWRNIPDIQARNVIAVESQYLAFHHYLINSLRHQSLTGGDSLPIGLSIRAGALKTATLICASIAEAALRAHAEARNLELPPEPQRRTFGRVLKAWQNAKGNDLADIAAIWDQLQRLHSGRNTVHLYAAIQEDINFYVILNAENQSLAEAEAVLTHLRNLVTT